MWARVLAIPDADLWAAHRSQKERLIRFVRERVRSQGARHGLSPDELRGVEGLLDPRALTIGFARRFATYKRATLLFQEPDRLAQLPVQVVVSGKAHPADDGGKELIAEITALARDPRFEKRSLVLAFEGMDAAGKGGAIRRLTAALDPRQFQVVPVSSPSEEERAQPYLWRFWRQLPRQGRVTLFDRSWYGRVLVERVEGLCDEADYLRAYSEINDFEHELHRAGTIVIKFWLQIDQKVQLRRFKDREKTGFKRFKITPDDWRNRAKWGEYERAVNDMVERTSTRRAPARPRQASSSTSICASFDRRIYLAPAFTRSPCAGATVYAHQTWR